MAALFILGECESRMAPGSPFDPSCKAVWNLASLFGFDGDSAGAEKLRKLLGSANFANAYPQYCSSKKLCQFWHKKAPSKLTQDHLDRLWDGGMGSAAGIIVLGVFAYRALGAFAVRRNVAFNLPEDRPAVLPAFIESGAGRPRVMLIDHTSQRSFGHPNRQIGFEGARLALQLGWPHAGRLSMHEAS